ncbi:unnamed protein product [Macrosiphum euphorbiae]|uniref:DUF4806 domain-containing protein n=1 Tax=Macrosiphum euphorbiae TaxID=13131 RepID=A0AAV0Y023_9HEMI|nr:unnamed protein product [Macrosiphum euphorbiae]
MKSPIRKKTTKDIDQDFTQPVSQSYHNKNDNSKFSLEKALSETDDFNQENAESPYSRHTILNSPIGKLVVEDNDQRFSYSHSRSLSNDRNNKSKFSSAKRTTIFDTIETDEIFNQENAESPYSRHTILNSPIGKIVVENNDRSFSYSHSRSLSNDRNNKSEFSSAKRTTIFDTIETDEIFNQDNTESSEKIYSILNSPIGKIVVKDNDKNFAQLHSMSQSNNKNSNTPRFSSAKTSTDKLMSNCDFQTFVINSLTKMKYDISGINSKTNATHILLNSYVTSSGNSIIQGQLNDNQISQTSDYYNLFPIQTEEDLQIAENRITDKIIRSNLVLQLSLLVGIKDVGDSVRRLMIKMFSDEVLTLYSLLGFKKKKNFSKLECYNLLIDALRVHPKFKNVINKEFDRPLATWIAHSSFRLNKSNKV